MKNISETVSIVVPVFNVELFLERCIKSILGQTYDNIEVILIDDGSTDKSAEICDRYMKKNNVKILHKKNEGLGYARNDGIKLATGKYITFVDSDDFLDEKYIEVMMRERKLADVETVICNFYQYWNMQKMQRINRCEKNEKIDDPKKIADFSIRLLGSLPEVNDTFAMSAWGILYSLEIINNHKIVFPSEREIGCEDIIFNLKYFSYTKSIYLISNSLYYYCYNNSSLTKNYNKERFMKHLHLFQEEKKLLKKLDLLSGDSELRLDWQLFIHIRMAIEQEIKKYGVLSKITYRNTKEIITNNVVQIEIKKYPIYRTKITQKLFLKLINLKQTYLLIFLMRVYMMKEEIINENKITI